MKDNENTILGKPIKIRNHPLFNIPILAGILLMVYGFFFYQLFAIFGGESEELSSVFSIVGAILMLVIHRVYFLHEYRGSFISPFWKNHLSLIVVGIFFVVDIAMGIPSYMEYGFAAPTLNGALMAVMAGFAEEAVFRCLPISVMMKTYKDKGNYLPALIIPAVLFGAIHLINVGSGAGFGYVAWQSLSAMIFGFLFCALYISTGSIIPSMFVHIIHDLLCSCQANQTSGVTEALQNVSVTEIWTGIVVMVAEIGLTLWLLLGKKEKIKAVWNHLWPTPKEEPVSEPILPEK